MTLAELDALIDAMPDAAAALLTDSDWKDTMLDYEAANRQERLEGGAFIYRGVWIWVVSPGPSRLLGRKEAEAAGLVGA